MYCVLVHMYDRALHVCINCKVLVVYYNDRCVFFSVLTFILLIHVHVCVSQDFKLLNVSS